MDVFSPPTPTAKPSVSLAALEPTDWMLVALAAVVVTGALAYQRGQRDAHRLAAQEREMERRWELEERLEQLEREKREPERPAT